MADNFLERQRQNYEIRKKAWLNKKKHLLKVQNIYKENYLSDANKID
mgnify:CR=1 FL=1